MNRTLKTLEGMQRGKAAYLCMTALVALYSAFVLFSADGNYRGAVGAAAAAGVAALLFWLLLALSGRFHPEIRVRAARGRLKPRAFLVGFALCACVMALYFAAFFPGGLSTDSLDQWAQVQSGQISDWHPALHTLILLLLSRVVNHPAFAVAVQLLSLAVLCGYMTCVLEAWGFPRWFSLCAAAWVSLNPATGNVMTFLWKDCAFALSIYLSAIYLLQAHLSRGAWLDRWQNALALGISLAAGSILRHNGALATVPILIWLFVSFGRKVIRPLRVTAAAAAIFLLVQGPVYSAFHVTRKSAESNVVELSGLPMAVMGNVVKHSPEALDEDIYAFLTRVAPQEVWDAHYALGDWNEMKWRADKQAVAARTMPELIDYTLRAARANPSAAWEALCRLWTPAIQPFDRADWHISPYVDASNPYGFVRSGNGFLHRILNGISRHTATPLLAWAIWNVGFLTLCVMFLCVFCMRRARASALLPATAIIGYNLGSMLLLSTTNDFRFFYMNVLVFPLAVACLLAQQKERPEK